MSKNIKIKKGLDINLKGSAKNNLVEIKNAESYAIKPTDFEGLTPKLAVKADARVKAGTPLFYDKYKPEIKFVSPVSGTVRLINRGERRKILEVVVAPDANEEYETFVKANPQSLSRDEIKENMLKSGVWPSIKQRPYSIVANPQDTPNAIFISAFDTAPLPIDYDFILEGKKDAFQTGIDALAKLTDGKLHLSIGEKTQSEILTKAKNVELHRFSGPHPAGLVGTQINKISPLNKGELIWVVNPQDVVLIGRLFLEGRFNPERIFALAGSEVKQPQYYKAKIGTQIQALVENNINAGNIRYISGNVLSGEQVSPQGYIGFYDSLVSVIPEGDQPELFGWALPGFGKFSLSRTFFSWLSPNKEFVIDSNMKGGERPFVVTGEMEKVVPLDILPMQLLKAIMINDIDLMEQLGIYEVAEEDFALCEFISTSKIPIQKWIRKGIDSIRKEFE